jgi:hypothetical protein
MIVRGDGRRSRRSRVAHREGAGVDESEQVLDASDPLLEIGLPALVASAHGESDDEHPEKGADARDDAELALRHASGRGHPLQVPEPARSCRGDRRSGAAPARRKPD